MRRTPDPYIASAPRHTPVLVDPDTVTAVVVAGDTHGNLEWLRGLAKRAARRGCKVLLIVGDFGWWPPAKNGKSIAAAVNSFAERYGIVVVFVDGNHEWHDDLLARDIEDDGFVTIAPRLRWAPRGTRWTWGGRTVGALGGAVSSDVAGDPNAAPPIPPRVEGENWWPAEALTAEQVARLGRDPLDVLFAHDAPASSPIVRDFFDNDPAVTIANDRNRDLVEQAMRATCPTLLLHGHHHARYTSTSSWIDGPASDASGELIWRSTEIHGLGGVHERGGRAIGQGEIAGAHIDRTWGVLDLATLTFSDGRDLMQADQLARNKAG